MHPHHHPPPAAHGHAAGLGWAFGLTVAFAAVEALAGWWSGSLALAGDAGHMISDAVALGLAGLAARLARRAPSARHSYGLARAEILAALTNVVFMLAVVGLIAFEAVGRLRSPQPVSGGVVVGVALAGLIVNAVVALRLHRAGNDLNVRAALLHVIGDALGSVAALAAGAVVWLTGWWPADPLLSLAICVLILYSAFRLLREALHVLMEGVPLGLDLEEVGQALAGVPGVRSVHDLHIWTVSSDMLALSAHVVVADLRDWPQILAGMQALLAQRFDIGHVTVQPETRVAAEAVDFVARRS